MGEGRRTLEATAAPQPPQAEHPQHRHSHSSPHLMAICIPLALHVDRHCSKRYFTLLSFRSKKKGEASQ